jgi:hypothetical protein
MALQRSIVITVNVDIASQPLKHTLVSYNKRTVLYLLSNLDVALMVQLCLPEAYL